MKIVKISKEVVIKVFLINEKFVGLEKNLLFIEEKILVCKFIKLIWLLLVMELF